jgi:hypothetical protein
MPSFHEECEVIVLTNEAIEIHISYLRPAVEAMRAEMYQMQKEMTALHEKLSAKIDQVRAEAFAEKIRKLG